jgi:hypothetical protein
VGIKGSKSLEARSARINQKSQALQSLLEPALLKDVDLKTSFQSFWFAVLTGMKTVDEAFGEDTSSEDFNQPKKMLGDDTPGRPLRERAARISIEEARQMGVLPIAYQR